MKKKIERKESPTPRFRVSIFIAFLECVLKRREKLICKRIAESISVQAGALSRFMGKAKRVRDLRKEES